LKLKEYGWLEDVIHIEGYITEELNNIITHEVCLNCAREVEICSCSKRETELQLIIYLIVFDRGINILVKFMGDLAEKLIGKPLNEIQQMRGKGEFWKFVDYASRDLGGKDIRITGNAHFNDYSKFKNYLLVTDFTFVDIDSDLVEEKPRRKKTPQKLLDLIQIDGDDYEYIYKSLGKFQFTNQGFS